MGLKRRSKIHRNLNTLLIVVIGTFLIINSYSMKTEVKLAADQNCEDRLYIKLLEGKN